MDKINRYKPKPWDAYDCDMVLDDVGNYITWGGGQRLVEAERERCIKCVEAEPVPAYHKDYPETDKVMIRTVVRTKKHIIKRIRERAESDTGDKNWLKNLWDKWPGDETDEEIRKTLEEMS